MRVLLPMCALLLSTGLAQAQTADPEALLREGVALRRAHRDAEALTRFEDALRIARTPRALAQVGLAEQAVGRWVQAEAHVRESVGSANDPWIAQNAPSLRAALGVIGQHLGDLWIDGGVEGAEVFVDGQRVTTLPMTAAVRVVAGSVRLEVRAEHHDTVTRPLTVPPGGSLREVVRLVPVTPTSRPTVAASAPPQSAAPSPVGSARAGGTQRILGWVTLAGAVVSTGVGIGAMVAREDAAGSYNTDATCPGVRSVGVQSVRCQGLIDEASTLERVGVATFVLGGALVVTSLVLLITAPNRERSAERTAVSCGPHPTGWGLTCAGRF